MRESVCVQAVRPSVHLFVHLFLSEIPVSTIFQKGMAEGFYDLYGIIINITSRVDFGFDPNRVKVIARSDVGNINLLPEPHMCLKYRGISGT